MLHTPPDTFRYVAVERHILGLIEAAGLGPGDRIPSLREMSARLSVSISTVNQAYLELESRGVVEARPKSGFFVRQARPRPPSPEPAPCLDASPTPVNRAALIRQVLDGMGRDDMIPLGVALTDDSLLPTKALGRVMARIAARPGAAAAYETVAGNLGLRRQVAFRAAEAGMEVRPEEIIVTSGAMEALYIALRTVTRPGDAVGIASPTYYCFLQLLENFGLRAVEIPSHPDLGVRPADLARLVDKFEIKACILTPNFNNPDGSLIPDPDKAEIVNILAARDIPVIEDDVYGDIHFTPTRPGCLRSHDKKGLVLHCSSFSKTLCAGYRVGYLMPGRFFDKAFEIKGTTNVCSATPTQLAVAEYLSLGQHDRHLRRLRAAIERQGRIMTELVSRHFPKGIKVSRPMGGTVLWIELPGQADSIGYFQAARRLGIGVAPGAIFSTQDKFQNFVRLSYGKPVTPDIERAVAALGALAGELADNGA